MRKEVTTYAKLNGTLRRIEKVRQEVSYKKRINDSVYNRMVARADKLAVQYVEEQTALRKKREALG